MRLNIYIQDKDMDVYNHIKSQLNQSGYIVDLVKKDMESKSHINKEEIIELIKKYAGEIKNTPDNPMDLEVKESVKELFDW